MAALTAEQVFHPQVLAGMVKRFHAGPNYFQKVLGLSFDSKRLTNPIPGIHGGWDLLEPNRAVGSFNQINAGPRKVTPHKVGHATGTCYVYYEAIDLFDNDMYPQRAIGGQANTIDEGAQSHIAYKVNALIERAVNLREFTVSRTLLGGYDMKFSDEQRQLPVESGDGDVSIDVGLPASHKGQLALGPSGADLIDTTWSSSTSDIAAMCSSVSKYMMFYSGQPLRHVFITTEIFNHMRKNTKLQSEGGSTVRPWESFALSGIRSKDGAANGGSTVEFRAIPNVLFHIVDSWLMLESANQTQDDQRDLSKTIQTIPANRVIMTPEADGSWLGSMAGSQKAKTIFGSVSSQTVSGTGTWAMPLDQPPGRTVHLMDIFLPYLKMRRAIMSPTVVF